MDAFMNDRVLEIGLRQPFATDKCAEVHRLVTEPKVASLCLGADVSRPIRTSAVDELRGAARALPRPRHQVPLERAAIEHCDVPNVRSGAALRVVDGGSQHRGPRVALRFEVPLPGPERSLDLVRRPLSDKFRCDLLSLE